MASKHITKVLTTPSKVASSLDWKKASSAILSLDIQKGQIGIAVAFHPSFQETTSVLDSIQISRQALSESIPHRIADIVKERDICGFVVSWPIQDDTGKLGYSFGLVLNTLDQLPEASKNQAVISSTRPFCLWDASHVSPTDVDQWGRSADYTRSSKNDIASRIERAIPATLKTRGSSCYG
jgi:RNase H-fold protein (predicted Holliday junction resolvase)